MAGSVIVRFLGDVTGLKKATSDADDAIGKVDKSTSSLAGKLQGDLKNALGDFGSGEMGVLSSTTAMTGGLSVAVGLAAVGVNRFLDLAEQVDNFGDVTGASAEDASRMVAVLKKLGIEPEQVEGSFAKLLKTVGNNDDALAKYGVTIARTKDGNVDLIGTVQNVARAWQATEDPAARAALGAAAFGKSWTGLVDLLDKTPAEIAAAFAAVPSGEILSEADIQSAKDFQMAWEQTKQTLEGFAVSIGRFVVPQLTSLLGAVDTVLGALDGFLSFGGGFFDNFLKFNPMNPMALINAFDAITSSGDNAKDSTAAEAAATAEAATKAREAAQAIADEDRALMNLTQSLLAAQSDSLALMDAQDKTAAAIDNANQKAYAALLLGGDNEQANKDLDKAVRNAQEAILAEATAYEKLAQDSAIAEGKTWTATDAQHALRSELGRVLDTLQPGTPLYNAVLGYIQALDSIPEHVSTMVDADTTAAQAKVDALQAKVNALTNGQWGNPATGGAGGPNSGPPVASPSGPSSPPVTTAPPVTTPGGGVVGGIPGSPGGVKKFAAGGWLEAGQMGIVGEHGPELFVPGRGGTIIPSGGGGGVVIELHVTSLDPRQAGDVVVDALTTWGNRNGPNQLRRALGVA